MYPGFARRSTNFQGGGGGANASFVLPEEKNANRPVARKRQGISLFLIARDVISGCSGKNIKCIAVNGEITTARF